MMDNGVANQSDREYGSGTLNARQKEIELKASRPSPSAEC